MGERARTFICVYLPRIAVTACYNWHFHCNGTFPLDSTTLRRFLLEEGVEPNRCFSGVQGTLLELLTNFRWGVLRVKRFGALAQPSRRGTS
jgi:hypothetical protein